MPSLIRERGEIQANAGLIWLAPGAYANVDYGITNFISAQVYGGFSLSGNENNDNMFPGTFHMDGSAGFYKNIRKFNLGIYGGYVYGQGGFDEVGVFTGPNYSWYGNYKIPYGKIQFIYAPVKKFCFGSIIKAGEFNMNYSKYYHESEDGYAWYANYVFIDRKSLLLEPSVFCIIRFTEKVGLTFSYTNSWLKEVDDNKIYSKIGENGFGYGNLGIGVVQKFDTKRKKE